MTENTMFPGRENYTGPTTGWFGLLHHSELYEQSHDVMERVDYVKEHKAENEIAIRLHNMIYLGGCEAVAKRDALNAEYSAKRDALYAEYWAKRDALYAEYWGKRDALYAEYSAKRDEYWAKLDALNAEYWAKVDPLTAEVLSYIKQYIPDTAWNGTELIFS